MNNSRSLGLGPHLPQLAIPIDGTRSLLIGLQSSGLPPSATAWELVRQAARFIGSWLAQGAAPDSTVDKGEELRSEVVGVGRACVCRSLAGATSTPCT